MPELMFRSLRRGKSSSFDVAKRREQSGPRRYCNPALARATVANNGENDAI
jgi:hypothetical protein